MAYQDRMKQAAERKRALANEIAQIRTRKDLSDLGKAQAIEAARERAEPEIAALDRQYRAERAAEHDGHMRTLFAPTYHTPTPSDADRAAVAQSYRDALARAAALPNGEAAQRAYVRARRSGDTLMQQALASAAYDEGWQDVLSLHAAESEGNRRALEELVALDGMTSPTTKLNRRLAFRGTDEQPEERAHRDELMQARMDRLAQPSGASGGNER